MIPVAARVARSIPAPGIWPLLAPIHLDNIRTAPLRSSKKRKATQRCTTVKRCSRFGSVATIQRQPIHLGKQRTSDEQQLIRLAKGANNFEQIKLNSPLYGNSTFPSSVQWDGTYMTASSASAGIGDGHYQPSYIYRLKMSGSAATIVGTTTFTGKRKLMTGQIWIDSKRIIASHYHGGGGIDSWSYPNAKKPHVIVPISTDLIPFGIAVSSGSH